MYVLKHNKITHTGLGIFKSNCIKNLTLKNVLFLINR